jgi:hypothetical protein
MADSNFAAERRFPPQRELGAYDNTVKEACRHKEGRYLIALPMRGQ